jgi:hypothetical protein
MSAISVLPRSSAAEAAVDRSRFGILVYVVAPGQSKHLCRPTLPRNEAPQWTAHTPMHHYARPEEVAGAVVFLCSEDANFITLRDTFLWLTADSQPPVSLSFPVKMTFSFCDVLRYRTTLTKRLSNSSTENIVRASGASGRVITTMNRMIVSFPKGTSFISLTIATLLSRSAID